MKANTCKDQLALIEASKVSRPRIRCRMEFSAYTFAFVLNLTYIGDAYMIAILQEPIVVANVWFWGELVLNLEGGFSYIERCLPSNLRNHQNTH